MKTIFLAAALLVALSASAQHPKDKEIISRVEIYDTETGERKVLKEYDYVVEAPNWTYDGKWLVYNSDGKIFRLSLKNPAVDEQVNTGGVVNCNNDHVLSFDGKSLAVSSGSADDWRSKIYTLPLGGVKEKCCDKCKGGEMCAKCGMCAQKREPKLVTPIGPSYLHGWSPDGKTLAYCADRGGNFDVYTIPVEGGEETRLTSAEGLDDGPEYSPDGEYLWFNSVRSGLMQVWRMKADGSEQTQITLDDARNSWFPHVSPDGRRVVYIAYKKGDVEPGDHPAGRNVELRMMSARQGGEPQTVVELFGGQGTINVNSWSPCSRYFAFVSYEYR